MFEQLKADIKKSLESKKQNDPQRLLKLLKDNPNQFLTIKEWSEIFKKPVPSTRRNLAGLEDNDVITRVGKKGSKGVKYGFGDDGDDGIWYKKLLKTGTTTENKWGKTSLKIEIYTYEKNDKCRFDSLLDAVIRKVPEVQYIDDGGYSSTQDSSGEDNVYQFESAYLVVESGQGTYFYNGLIELKDTNETPC